jgi:hypothetical protein
MMTCCNYREDLDKPCEGRMAIADNQVEFVCDTCKGRCGVQVHPDHAEYVSPTYEIHPFSDVAEHLHEVRRQHHTGKPLTWTGPDDLHYSITAGVQEPSWHFSPDGLEYNREHGRGFWDAFIQVAFMFGWHNGVVKHEQSEKIAKDSDKRWIDLALKDLEAGRLDAVKSHLEFLRKVR